MLMKTRTWREKMEAMGVTHKDCSKCGEYKHFDEFGLYYNPKSLAGLQSWCRQCGANDRFNRMNDPAYRTLEKKNFRFLRIIAKVKTRAKAKGLAYDLHAHKHAIRDRIAAGKCELTGIPFEMNAGGGTAAWNSPSIDRIIPDQGYVYSNIRIILHGLNCGLGSWGEDAFRTIAEAYLGRN